MKTKPLLVLAVLAAAALGAACSRFDGPPPPTGTGIGQRVPEFRAELVRFGAGAPATGELDSLRNPRVTVYAFLGASCPASQAYSDRFKALESAYSPKGVDFVYIYSNSNDTPEAKRSFHSGRGFSGPMVDDQEHRLSKLFQAQRTSELFLVDRRGVVLYHGSLDDSRDPAGVKNHYLATALDEHLAGKPVTTSQSQVFA